MEVRVRVPATSANLGAGVDCLGLAIRLYLDLDIRTAAKNAFAFGKGFDEPIPDKDNLVLASMRFLAERAGKELPPLEIRMDSAIPLSRGLGSSSSAIIAGLKGADAVLGTGFSDDAVLRMAVEIEGHPDNVAPALLGGFTMAMYDNGSLIARKYSAPKVRCVFAVPDYRLSTSLARSALPGEILLTAAVGQLQRAVLLGGALAAGDLGHLGVLTRDELFTPARAPLMPGCREAMRAAADAGALCAFVSGAGPTLLALARENEEAIGEQMKEALAAAGVSSRILCLDPDDTGACVHTEA